MDEILSKDSNAYVACGTAITNGLVYVIGEISTNSYIDIPNVVRNVIVDIVYNNLTTGFDGNICGIISSIHSQSADIAMG